MPRLNEMPRLIVDSEWGYVGRFDFALFGRGEHVPQEGVTYEPEIVEYARSLGVQVVKAETTAADTSDYLMAGPSISDAEVKKAVPDVLIPKTQTYDEYSAEPHFPVLAKGRGYDRGEAILLLEEPEQWEKLKRFLGGEGPLRRVDPELERQYQVGRKVWDGQPKAQAAYDARWKRYVDEIENPIPAFQRNLRAHFDYQQFIETPSDHYSSYRVLVAASGAILASSLYYSAQTTDSAQVVATTRSIRNWGTIGDSTLDFLVAPDSLVYLNARCVTSNHTRGGHGVVLNPTRASKKATAEDKAILEAHGLDPNEPALPEQIRDQSQRIAQALGREHGFILGIDWLQEKGTGKSYYLETNLGPIPGAYADAHMGGTDGVTLDRALVAMEKAALDTLPHVAGSITARD